MGYREYLEELIKEGYIAEDGHPLKCHECEGTEMETRDEWHGDYGRIDEYTLQCKTCKAQTGHWAYGGWRS